jgi:hypothetical protein
MPQLQVEAGARTHGGHQRVGDGEVANHLALAFHVHRPARIKVAQGLPDQGLEALLRRLSLAWNHPHTELRWLASASRVQHLRALRSQCLQQPGLAGPRGAAHYAVLQPLRQGGQGGQHRTAEPPCSPLRQGSPESRSRSSTRASEPLRLPPRQQYTSGCQWRGLSRPPARYAAAMLAATSAAPCFLASNGLTCTYMVPTRIALGVVERRPVDRARQTVQREFVFAAGVDDGAELRKPFKRVGGWQGTQAHFNSFRNSGQTLSSMIGCASSRG